MKFTRITIPAFAAISTEIKQGQTVRIVNTDGGQVVDTWAFSVSDFSEHLSMSHSRTATYHIFFCPGDTMVSNLFNPFITFIADTTAGVHDTLHAACSEGSNRYFDTGSIVPNCQNNLLTELNQYGVSLTSIPDPWNVFEETRITKSQRMIDVMSSAQPGDYVELRAEQDILLVCSACPSTVGNISGQAPRGAALDLEIIKN